MDSEECLVEDISSSSDKEIWEIVNRKRLHPVREDGNGEELVELAHPPKTGYSHGSGCCFEQRFREAEEGKGQ